MISYSDIKSGRAAVPAAAAPVAKEIGRLPALVEAAAAQLAKAKDAAEVLDAKDRASLIYDAAKRAARLAAAKGAHDTLIAEAHRAQANALKIEAQAKERLADEYDAAQERGDAAKPGKPVNVPDGNNKAKVEETGLTRKQVHDARRIRNAELAQPGVVEKTVETALAEGKEPTRAMVNAAVAEALGEEKPAPEPRNIFDELVALWKEAGPDVRQDFKAYIRGDEFIARANPSGPGANITMRHENIQTSPSAVASAEPEASPSPPPASGNLSDPHASSSRQADKAGTEPPPSVPATIHSPATLAVADSQPSIPSSDALAAGQGDTSGENAKSERAVTNFSALSKADQIRLLRPHCQHPGTDLCGGVGTKHCSACAKIAAGSEAA